MVVAYVRNAMKLALLAKAITAWPHTVNLCCRKSVRHEHSPTTLTMYSHLFIILEPPIFTSATAQAKGQKE